jgi:DMSO/TMAO reductase YedYZ molybdopterin-dependent catalytic subunit
MASSKPHRVTAGIGAGAGAALAMMLAMAGLRFGFGLSTIPELMLNPVVKALGGQAFSDALDRLYYAGRPLLFTFILEGTLLLGALLGLLYAWLARPGPSGTRRVPFNTSLGGILYGLVIGLLLNTVFLPIVEQPVFADQPYGIVAASSIPLRLGLKLLALIYGVTLHGLLPKPEAEAVAPVEADAQGRRYLLPQETSRREFLRIAGGAGLALVGGVLFTLGGTILNQGGLRSPVDRPPPEESASDELPDTPTPPAVSQAQPTDTSVPEPTKTIEPPKLEVAQDTPTPEPAPTDTAVLPEPTLPPPTSTPQHPQAGTPPVPAIKVREITPTDSFYHVSKNFFDPSPSADGWKLDIKGLVNKPYSLTYKQLTAMPAQVVTVGMMCISNPIGGGLIGNTLWKGVRLADLLKKAGPKPSAVEVAMQAVDGYTDSITLQKAMDPDVMLVWEMGGAPLTSQHGFPARLLVPGIYGMKHVKWITSFELVDYDFKGFWQQPDQGWNDPAPVNTMSRIDVPTDGTLSLKKQTLSGVAFAGDRSISKVELSTDGGKTWNRAYIKPPASHTTWVVWGYEWTPTAAGKYTVMVRATDGEGDLQTSRRTDPYPSGATGYHTVRYQVRG